MSLCYLWQREQEPLLKEMLDSGVQAIMVKVATAGLCGRQLGKSMNELQPLLLNLVTSNRLLNDTNSSHATGEDASDQLLRRRRRV